MFRESDQVALVAAVSVQGEDGGIARLFVGGIIASGEMGEMINREVRALFNRDLIHGKLLFLEGF